jgi:hypothetical protein
MSIKQLVQAGFGAFGLRLTRVSNEPKHYYDQMDSFFLVLKRRGFSPNHIVDVGANHGYWTRTSLKYFPDVYYTLIEPQDFLRENVQDLLAREDGNSASTTWRIPPLLRSMPPTRVLPTCEASGRCSSMSSAIKH